MSEEPIKETSVDAPPKSGVFIDQERFYQNMTPEEIAEGEHLGAETDDVDFIEDADGNRIPIGGDDDEPGEGTE
jgi:hypothetical protein